MEVHIYNSVKAKSQGVNMSQRYSDNTKRPGESAAGVTYLSMRIHPRSCLILPLKVVATLLSGSRKGAIGA